MIIVTLFIKNSVLNFYLNWLIILSNLACLFMQLRHKIELMREWTLTMIAHALVELTHRMLSLSRKFTSKSKASKREKVSVSLCLSFC